MLRAELQRHLLRYPAIRRHLGDRVFLRAAPQGTPTPYLTYTLTSRPSAAADLAGEGELRKQQWQFDVWIERKDDPTGAVEAAIDRALEEALMDFRGTMGHVVVQSVDYVGGFDGSSAPDAGSDNTLNRLMQEYEFLFEV
jgi:hypothetical protein